MKTKAIPIEALPDAIAEILTEYSDEICDGVTEQTLVVAEKGAQAVNTAAASQGFRGRKYKRSWYVKNNQVSRLYTSVTICSKQYRVAHLLEKSHPVGIKGHFTGRPHIKPVEEEIIREYEDKVKKVITG